MNLTFTINALLDATTAKLDRAIMEPVFAEFVNLERRFYLGDWGPAECDSGRFCEALVTPLGVLDRGLVVKQSPGKFAESLVNHDTSHQLSNTDRRNLSRSIASVYEIRSSRNSVHLSPEYTADYVDSMFVLSACKWLLCELVRLSVGLTNEETARHLRGITQLGDPIVFEIEGRSVIMRTDLSAPQELLLLLLHQPGYFATKVSLINLADGYHTAKAVGTALGRLEVKREVVKDSAGRYHLTTLGKKAALSLVLPK